MNYHDTVPTIEGLYLIDRNEALFLRDGQWSGNGGKPVDDVERFMPMLGPLPDADDAMLSLACEVAFARMAAAWAASQDWFNKSELPYVATYDRFTGGERSLSLLREIERVTGELTKK